MEAIMEAAETLNGWLWGIPTLILLVGTGILLTIRLRFIQFRKLGEGFSRLLKGNEGEGEVSPFESLCVALASCIGTGNIVGVAVAITTGGAGALVWMIIAALLGMATMYAEATMAVKYRKVEEDGTVLGGPFYYIEQGIGWKWLAVFFAIATMLAAALGIGSLSQIGSITGSINNMTSGMAGVSVFGNEISFIAIGVGLFATVTAGIVIIGGVKSIAKVATKIVPVMAGLYLAGGLIILALNITNIPGAIGEIISNAFSFRAVGGGVSGTIIMLAIQKGVSRGVFSNEAGLGSNPIASAAARADKPCHQGVVSMIGVFIDTVLICTMTGLVIVVTGAHNQGLSGVAVTEYAFRQGVTFAPWLGTAIVSFGLIIFAYTTILGWCYYGERSCAYLFGEKNVIIYKCFYIVVLLVGIFLELTFIITIADILNALMVIPNLIGLLYLLKVIQKESAEYLPGYSKN